MYFTNGRDWTKKLTDSSVVFTIKKKKKKEKERKIKDWIMLKRLLKRERESERN